MIYMRSLVLLWALSLSAVSLGADDPCSLSRMDEKGGSMEHVAVRKQGSVGICAAETAAQLVDAWRFTHGDQDYGFQTSAFFAALDRNESASTYTLKTSVSTKAMLEEIMSRGSCDERVVSESLGALLGDDSLQQDSVEAILNSPRTRPRLVSLFDKCQASRRVVSALPQIGVWGFRVGTPIQEIEKQLLSLLSSPKNQPVGIDFCSTLLNWGIYTVGLDPSTNKPNIMCDNHGALLIGKRRNSKTGSCEFLIRNSWGTNCGGSDLSSDWECDHGNIWVDALALSRNILAYETWVSH